MGNITSSQEVVDLTKFHTSACKKHSPAFAPSFQCPFIHCLQSLCFLFTVCSQEHVKKWMFLPPPSAVETELLWQNLHFPVSHGRHWCLKVTDLDLSPSKSYGFGSPRLACPLLGVIKCAVEKSWSSLFASAELVEGREKSHRREQLPLLLSCHSNLFGVSRDTAHMAKAKKK